MSFTQFPLLPDTSTYGDMYMRGGVFREVAVLNSVPSSMPGERRTCLGFFGIDAQTNTQHAVVSLEAKATDNSTRHGQFGIRVNRGTDGMQPSADTLTLDGSGNFRLFNQANERTFSVDTQGNVEANANISAASMKAKTKLQIGDNLTLSSDPNGSSNIDIKSPTGVTALRISDAGLDLNGPASFNNDVVVNGDLVFGNTWRIVQVADRGLYVQKNVDGIWLDKMRISG